QERKQAHVPILRRGGLFDVADDDLGGALGRDVVFADLRRDEERLALLEGLGELLLFAEEVLPLAVDHGVDDAAGRVGLLGHALAAELDGLHRELLALDEQLAAVGEAGDARRLVLRDAHRVEVGDVHRLLDVELAGLLVAAHAAPVGEAVRRVGVLLDLEEHHAAVGRVDRAGRDEDDVLLLHVHDVEALLDGSGLEVLLELGDRRARQHAADDAGVLGGVEDVPRLHLADALRLVPLGVVVGRMNLERQLVVTAEELDEQRIALEAHRMLVPEDLLAVGLEELVEAPPLVRAVDDDAGALLALGELPGFAGLLARALLAHDLGELGPAPDLLFVDFLEAKRINRRGTLGHG